MSNSEHQILGIYETHLPVRDLAKSVSFYRDRVGLELASEFPEKGIAFFWVGQKETGMLGLWANGTGPLQMQLHFAFRVSQETVVNSCQSLALAGITPLGFSGEQVSEPVVIGWMPAVSVYFKDPDGHSIEKIHVLDAYPVPKFGVQSYSAWLNRD
ncbi:MAG: VOC family protein [Cypionkella sp.]